jgi:hypothetical protein
LQNKLFFGPDELLEHLMRSHETCHICKKTGNSSFYRNYDHLVRFVLKLRLFLDHSKFMSCLCVSCVQERHFRKAHFLCDDSDCMVKKFIVFEDEMALQAHKVCSFSVSPSLVVSGIQ